MAITYTAVVNDSVNGVATYTGTADTNSAASSISPGFEPSEILVYQVTNNITYRWAKGMTAGHMNKVIANGTQTHETSNGITVTGAGSATGPVVTFGTGIHTNSASFVVVLRR